MVLFNYATRELTAKIVYYGPGLCGKTTNLEYIHKSLPEKTRGKMLSLATQTDRTLFFDFLPIDLGSVKGMKTRVQLYTVPGQVFYDATRKLVLKGADGVVFVADSQREMFDSNLESWENLRQNLQENGLDINTIPMVVQMNKRDLPNVMPVKELNQKLNEVGVPYYEAVAITGKGVQETLKGIAKVVLENLSQKYTKEGKELKDKETSAALKSAADLIDDAEELVEDLPGPVAAVPPEHIDEFDELEELHDLKPEVLKKIEPVEAAPVKTKKGTEKTMEVKRPDLPPEAEPAPAPPMVSDPPMDLSSADFSTGPREFSVSASSPSTDLHVPVEVTVGKGEQVIRLQLSIDLKIKIVS